MIVGLSIIPITLMIGIAIDSSLAYNADSRLQGAVDASVLAGARMLNAEPEDMKAEARMFFDANFPEGYLGSEVIDFDANFNSVTRELTVDATIEVPTSVMNMAGVSSLTISSSAAAQQQLNGLELALVLDTTGSMRFHDRDGGTKMEAMKEASEVLLDAIYGEADTVENVSVSVVPYTSVVNVGSDRTDWLLDEDDQHEDFDTDDWAGCVESRGGTIDRDDTSLSSGDLYAYFFPAIGSRWNRFNDPNAYCIDHEILPLTAEKSTALTRINSLSPYGGTMSLVGFVWGWRSLSPNWRESWDLDEGPVDYDEENFKKAIVMMTDGETTFYTEGYNAYGLTDEGRIGSSDTDDAEDIADARLLESCQLAKAQGIEIFSVMYDLRSEHVETLFRSCASSPDHFFDVPDGDLLRAAFENIGGRLISLHLSQ